MYSSQGLGKYNCYGFQIPYKRYNRTLGNATALPVTSDPFTSGLSTFGVGLLQSPWLYVGLGLLGFSLYLGPLGRAKQRRKRKNLITPLTAGLYAAGAGAGGYLIGKYTGL